MKSPITFLVLALLASLLALTVSPGATGAAFPLDVAALIYVHEQKVIGAGSASHSFGNAVSLSGDTALVGAPYDDIGANDEQGSAYIFTRTGATWSFQQQLTAPDGAAYDDFGYSVSLSGDTALVGAAYDDVGANDEQGSAYVFTRSGTTWSFQQQLTAPDGAAYDYFGWSVSLSGDSALVGAPGGDAGAGWGQGSAYVFVRSGATWSFQQQLLAPDGAADDWLGHSVSLSGDTALVGAPSHDAGANDDQGSAYVFVRSGTTWSFQQQFTAPDGAAYNNFGSSVSLSGDTALVGAPGGDAGAGWGQGSAYVFVRSGATWSFEQQLTAPDGAAYDDFGYSVSLSGDRALVGAPYGDVGANIDQGSAYFYRADATPSVLSITRASPNPTNAAAVDFTVTFSEAVTGVDAADFTLTTTGSLSAATIDSIAGSAATYTVTVTTGADCGTLRLDLPASATVADLAGLPLSDLPYTGGQAYTLLCAVFLPQLLNSDS